MSRTSKTLLGIVGVIAALAVMLTLVLRDDTGRDLSIDTSSPLLDEARFATVGQPGRADRMHAAEVIQGDLIMVVNSEAVDASGAPDDGTPVDEYVARVGLGGSQRWRTVLPAGEQGRDLLQTATGPVLVLSYRKADTTAIVRTLDETSGEELRQITVPWRGRYQPGQLAWLGTDQLLVLGHEAPDSNKRAATHGVIVTANGNVVQRWVHRAHQLVPLSNGYIGFSEGDRDGRTRTVTIERYTATGRRLWVQTQPDTSNALFRGVAEVTRGGDLLLAGFDPVRGQELILRLSSRGEIRWLKHPAALDGLIHDSDSMLPWGDGRWLVAARHRVSTPSDGGDPGTPSALAAFLIDADGTVHAIDARLDLALQPLHGVQPVQGLLSVRDDLAVLLGTGTLDRDAGGQGIGAPDIVIGRLPVRTQPPAVTAKPVETH